MSEKLTPAQKKALTWIGENEPVSLFPVNEAPAFWFIKRLVTLGLVDRTGRESGNYGFTKYAVSEKGRSMLKRSQGRA